MAPPPSTSIPELLRIELEELQVPAPTSALLALAGVGRGEPIPPQRTGRVMAFERERFARTREAPRLAVGLASNGTAARPPHLALGSWRLARRVIIADAARGHAAALGIRLCERAVRVDPAMATGLREPAIRAAAAVLGPGAAQRELATAASWEQLRSELVAARPGGGADAITVQQYEVEALLHEAQLTGAAMYFGADAPLGSRADGRAIRLPLTGEVGRPLDDLVRARAGDPQAAREVLAFIDEWGQAAEQQDEPLTSGDFAAFWRVSEDDVQRQLDLFRTVLPTEVDPSAIHVVLWDGVAAEQGRRAGASFVRLTSVAVTDDEPPSITAYFLTSLYDQLDSQQGTRLRRALRDTPVPPASAITAAWPLFELADVALHRWGRAALIAAMGSDDIVLKGLHALGSIHDRESAANAERWVGSVRRERPRQSGRSALLSLQRCLRACASLPPDDALRSTAPLFPGIRLAAGVLAAVAVAGATDVVVEVRMALEAMTDHG
ncbi:MAG TPA: hypothetical protein VK501_10185 [Baekduia sp.]|uniref:hypothetical protein n=1 Tax=Baekduia sp. TaxID=2600305 RepID=UPI002BC3C203|nr:hypothetical protein [Baekduia sp.]HMJ34277.1 hypothetical protein [Baekduia sp.]